MNKNRNKANSSNTEIMIIADRSGSMCRTIDEARGSINRLIKDQQKVKGKAYFSFAMFDEVYTRNRESVDIGEVEPIGKEYSARGMTALLDAVGRSINYLEDRIKKLTEKPDHVIVAIITDGFENASQEYTKPQIAELVKKKKEDGWEFKFIGANIDAFAEGVTLGFATTDVYEYDASNEGTRVMYADLSSSISQTRSN